MDARNKALANSKAVTQKELYEIPKVLIKDENINEINQQLNRRNSEVIRPQSKDSSRALQRNGTVDGTSSNGSIFQKNAASFYGLEAPAPGERPFKISKPTADEVKLSKGFSLLQQTRQEDLSKDPKFQKNAEYFFEGKA